MRVHSSSLSALIFSFIVPSNYVFASPQLLSTASSSDSQTVSGSTSTSAVIPSSTLDPTTVAVFQQITSRRVTNIITELGSASSVGEWLSTLGSNGQWPSSQIDYTVGCAAQRANWPAETHWSRISIMTGAWYGGMSTADPSLAGNATLRAAISSAMGFWFESDFTDLGCLDNGGNAPCPCGTPGFWNTNWYSNIIGVPLYLSETCLLLNATLTATELGDCTNILVRSYGAFDHYINGLGYITGANTLDLAKIGIDEGLLVYNTSMLTDAFTRIHNEVVIQQGVSADGIRPDGSFGQHEGIIYNGNYGYVYSNDVLDLEIEAADTQYAANSSSQMAMETLFDGDRWMIFMNSVTGVLHWDYSVLPRFISFPVADGQATSGININVTKVGVLGKQWNSSSLLTFSSSLQENVTNANAGNLVGYKVFFDNDYIVHRGQDYVSTLRMFSSRSNNTECLNLQNPFGFHLADGTQYTFLSGNEYEDIFAAWDWNLIPGITTDYGNTVLDCNDTEVQGIQAFVGGATTGSEGIAVMRYTNPKTLAFNFQKAWFFLPGDVEHVMVANVSSASSAPIFSVLDQKKHNGDIYIDSTVLTTTNSQIQAFNNATTLWHDSVGYLFNMNTSAFALNLKVGDEVGNWSAIGISAQPIETVDLFAAWIHHQTPLGISLSYTIYPAISHSSFSNTIKSGSGIQDIQNDAHVSAAYQSSKGIAMFVFWDQSGGQTSFSPLSFAEVDIGSIQITVSASANLAIILDMQTGNVTVSDPSQMLSSVSVTIGVHLGQKGASSAGIPSFWCTSANKTLDFTLPSSGLAGSSISMELF